MRTNGFFIEDDIYVVSEGKYYDLHNDFDFVGHKYVEDEHSLSLSWVISVGDWVRPGQPASLRLHFEGVSFFQAIPRNPKLPAEEDSCLDGFYFISDEDWCEGPFSGPSSGNLKSLPENCKHYISFMSDADMILMAEVCSLHLGETT